MDRDRHAWYLVLTRWQPGGGCHCATATRQEGKPMMLIRHPAHCLLLALVLTLWSLVAGAQTLPDKSRDKTLGVVNCADTVFAFRRH